MIDALETYLDHLARTGDHAAAVVRAAERLAETPWEVVRVAGLLARCTVEYASRDLGLTRKLTVTAPAGKAAVLNIARGQPYPSLAHVGRRSRGAFDAPVDMARRVVGAAIAEARVPVRVALDPACGAGAFLLAAKEAGIPEIYGTDLDDTAIAVAQIAVPEARLVREDAFKHGPPVDLVVGNPPFIPPELQDARLRRELRLRFPWLQGRFDASLAWAASAAQRVNPGGAAGLILPASMLIQPYGARLRRRWVERHRVAELSGPHPFPGTSLDVAMVVLGVGQPPDALPVYGIEPAELLRLENVPLNPDLMPGDVDLVERIRAASVPLGELATIDAGLVAHGPHAGKEMLIHDEPGEGRVPYADARDFFAGERAWLDYRPSQMQRPKRPELFEVPKIVVQAQRMSGPIRAAIDRDHVYVGQSCTVIAPGPGTVGLEALLELVRSPLLDGIARIELGRRAEPGPRDLARVPVPRAWVGSAAPVGPEAAWGLRRDEVARLRSLAR